MDIAELKAFLAVAENGSFSRAAEKTFITQPAVSKRISGLETKLGLRLFDRIGRRIQLTEAGRTLLPRCQTLLNEVSDIERQLSNLHGDVTGPLRMGTSHHIGLHRLPPALTRFHQQYSQASLDIRFMDSEFACREVAEGKLELAMVTLPSQSSHPLILEKIWDDPLEIVVGRNHPLANQQSVSLETLVAHPAILPGPGTFTREKILSALGNFGDRLAINMATNYLEVLRMLAAIGLGWTALPRTMIDEDLIVVHAEGMAIQRELGIVTHEARSLSNAAQAMMEIIKGMK